MKLFIVVREDRHFDHEITVHRTRVGADRAIEEFISRYEGKDHYKWTEENCGKDIGWLRYMSSNHEDGPNVRIEAGELEP